MEISDTQAQEQYLRARDALDAISRSRKATEQQKRAVRRERDRLDLEFIGQSIHNIQERTVKFQEFVNNMERLISNLETDLLLRGMKELSEVIVVAKPLIVNDE
jgi:hypothetical protein